MGGDLECSLCGLVAPDDDFLWGWHMLQNHPEVLAPEDQVRIRDIFLNAPAFQDRRN